jgi:hypothetical protein
LGPVPIFSLVPLMDEFVKGSPSPTQLREQMLNGTFETFNNINNDNNDNNVHY